MQSILVGVIIIGLVIAAVGFIVQKSRKAGKR
jgi:hypothetical protein